MHTRKLINQAKVQMYISLLNIEPDDITDDDAAMMLTLLKDSYIRQLIEDEFVKLPKGDNDA